MDAPMVQTARDTLATSSSMIEWVEEYTSSSLQVGCVPQSQHCVLPQGKAMLFAVMRMLLKAAGWVRLSSR